MSRTVDVVILGAGLSGLSAAYYLKQHGLQTLVLEKSSNSGGVVRTSRNDDFILESGPNSALATSGAILGLIEQLGLSFQLEYANRSARKRYIVRDGKLMPVPMSVRSLLKTSLVSAKGRLRLLAEPFVRANRSTEDEALAEFVRRRLGSEVLDYLVNPFVAGVYAGSPEKLSLKGAFQQLYDMERDHGSLFRGVLAAKLKKRRKKTAAQAPRRIFSFYNGMQTLTDALAGRVAKQLETGADVKEIVRDEDGFLIYYQDADDEVQEVVCSQLLFTIPAHAYAVLPGEAVTPLKEIMGAIRYVPVATVFFGYKDLPTTRPLDGFGFLVPEVEERQILGSIWNSALFPGRAPEGGCAFTTFVGGARNPELLDLDNEALREIVVDELRDLVGVWKRPDFCRIHRWQQAIPQYQPGHPSLIKQIAAFEADEPDIHIGGNFRGGVSVADCVKQAEIFAQRIARRQQEMIDAQNPAGDGQDPPFSNKGRKF